VQGARFCINCGSALDLKAPAPPGVTAPPPYQPPYPYAQPRQTCEQRPRQEEECMGQTRVPGLVVFAVIILMIGVFAVIQWYVQETYPTSNYANLIWPLFGIVMALVLIGVWLVARPRAR
jgi:hypothetical protein